MTIWSQPVVLTSEIYPVDVVERFQQVGIVLAGAPFYYYREAINNHAGLVSGGLFPALFEYNNYPPEAFEIVGISFVSGSLTPALYSYNNYPPEAYQIVGGSLQGGTGPTNALITYSNYPVERYQIVGVSLQSGTLV
jgi:hypothetical protein